MESSPDRAACRKCGACCIAPSISSPLPGMPGGKPADVRCAHLAPDNTCLVYASRPPVCRDYSPAPGLCGKSFEDAMAHLGQLEEMTANPRPGIPGKKLISALKNN